MTTRCTCHSKSNPEPQTASNVVATIVVAASVVGLGVIFFRKYNEGMKDTETENAFLQGRRKRPS